MTPDLENALVGLVVADLAVFELLSVFYGVVVARSQDAPWWKGLLIGALLPIAGPLVWAAMAIWREPSLASASLTFVRRRASLAPAVLLTFSAAAFVTAALLPWGGVRVAVGSYRYFRDTAATDTQAGALAALGCAVLLALGATATLVSTARRRIALLSASIGAAWVVVTTDGLIAMNALNEVGGSVEDISAGRVETGVVAEAGLWVAMLAALLAVVAAVVLARVEPVGETRPQRDWRSFRRLDRHEATLVAGADRSTSRAAQPAPPTDVTYGDGF